MGHTHQILRLDAIRRTMIAKTMVMTVRLGVLQILIILVLL